MDRRRIGVAPGALTRRQVVGSTVGALAVLAACGTGGGSAPPAAKEVAGTIQPMVRASAADLDTQHKAFALFQEQHPKIKVEPIDVAGGQTYSDKTRALLAADTPPALWFAGGGEGFRYWAAKGRIENLDPYIKRDKFDMKVFSETFLSNHKYDGHYMALPASYFPWALFHNKSLFDAAGVKYPTKDWNDKTWTWDKFLDVGKALTKTESGKITQFGVGAVGAAPRFTAMMLGGDWFPEEGYDTGWIKKFTGTAPEVIDAYQYQSDLQNKFHVQPTADDTKELGLSIANAFPAGKIAMHIAAVSYFSTLAKAKGVPWSMAAIPIGAAKARRTLIWVDYWCFFNGQKSPDAVWELLKFMVGPEAQKLYPISTGPMSSLKSLTNVWAEQQQRDVGVSADDIKVAVQGVDVQHVSADNFTVNWPDLWDALMAPVTKVLAGQSTAKQGIGEAAPAAEAAIQKSLAK